MTPDSASTNKSGRKAPSSSELAVGGGNRNVRLAIASRQGSLLCHASSESKTNLSPKVGEGSGAKGERRGGGVGRGEEQASLLLLRLVLMPVARQEKKRIFRPSAAEPDAQRELFLVAASRATQGRRK